MIMEKCVFICCPLYKPAAQSVMLLKGKYEKR